MERYGGRYDDGLNVGIPYGLLVVVVQTIYLVVCSRAGKCLRIRVAQRDELRALDTTADVGGVDKSSAACADETESQHVVPSSWCAGSAALGAVASAARALPEGARMILTYDSYVNVMVTALVLVHGGVLKISRSNARQARFAPTSM